VEDRRRGDLVGDPAEETRRAPQEGERAARRVEHVGLRRADFGRAEFALGQVAHAVAPGPVVSMI
jgi:hypothetical protein